MKAATLVSLGLLTLSLMARGAAPDISQGQVVARSISGILDGIVTLDPSDISAVVSVGECDGIVTHFGTAKLETWHTSDGGQIKDGVFTLAGASGDTIHGTFQGTVTWDWEQNVAIGNTIFVVTGGTGRFAQASGQITSTSSVTPDFSSFVWPVTWVWEGTLSF